MTRQRAKQPAVTSLPTCCTDMDIDLLDLAMPERLDRDGREFVEAHGILKVPLGEVFRLAVHQGGRIVKVRHVCDKLDIKNGRCTIYNRRPIICRKFDCKTRHDCDCKGAGLIQQ